LTERCLVTVLAPNSTTADSLATALSVLGPLSGLDLIAGFPGVHARIQQFDDGAIRTYDSPRFRRWLAPVE